MIRDMGLLGNIPVGWAEWMLVPRYKDNYRLYMGRPAGRSVSRWLRRNCPDRAFSGVADGFLERHDAWLSAGRSHQGARHHHPR